MRTITLRDEEFDRLLIMCGYAVGAATENTALANAFIQLTNRINEGNPNWTPYKLLGES